MNFNKEHKTTSFLSNTCELYGNLYTKGGIRIDGKLNGYISCDSTVYIGDTAEIEAQISTRSLVSSGSVTGNVVADDTVQINHPGSLRGEVKTCNMGIEKNVYFNGRCQLLSPEVIEKPKLSSPKIPRKAIPNRD